jgi:hypothetical protein
MIPYATPMPHPRPTAVSVLAIIGIVYASIGLLNALLGMAMQVIATASGGAFGPTASKLSVSCTIALAGGSLILAGVLMTASIGSLRMRAWARKLMVRWACFYLAWEAVEVTVQTLIVVPEAVNAYASATAAAGAPAPMPGVPGLMKSMMYGGVVFAFIFCCVLPICVLIFMRKPNVIEAFEQAEAERAGQPVSSAPLTGGLQP